MAKNLKVSEMIKKILGKQLITKAKLGHEA
jgi:hypothetical protein